MIDTTAESSIFIPTGSDFLSPHPRRIDAPCGPDSGIYDLLQQAAGNLRPHEDFLSILGSLAFPAASCGESARCFGSG
jgi:hypothetical protein